MLFCEWALFLETMVIIVSLVCLDVTTVLYIFGNLFRLHAIKLITVLFTCCEGSQTYRGYSTSTEPSLVDSETVANIL